MANPRSQTVTKSRQKAAADGRKRLTTMLSDEGSALYRKLIERYPSEREMIEAGLNALDGRNELTKAELLAEIERRMK
jgi:hypothetical protein